MIDPVVILALFVLLLVIRDVRELFALIREIRQLR